MSSNEYKGINVEISSHPAARGNQQHMKKIKLLQNKYVMSADSEELANNLM